MRHVHTGTILLEHTIMLIFFQEGNELGDYVSVHFSINRRLKKIGPIMRRRYIARQTPIF